MSQQDQDDQLTEHLKAIQQQLQVAIEWPQPSSCQEQTHDTTMSKKADGIESITSLQVLDKEKRSRKSFAVEQLLALEYQYAQTKYLKGIRRLLLARRLNLTDAQVKIWFQNRRAKDNRESTSSMPKTTPPQHVPSLKLHHKHVNNNPQDLSSGSKSLFIESHAADERRLKISCDSSQK